MALSIGELVGYVDLDTSAAESAVDKIGGTFDRAGSSWGKMLGGAGIAAAGLFGAGLAGAINLEPSRDRVAAALGLTEQAAERAGRVSAGLYADAWGESAAEVDEAVEAVMSSIGGMRTASEADLSAVTESALTFATAMGVDVGRASQVAGQLVRTGLAKDAGEAFDLLTAASSRVPVELREDVLDASDEYGQFFAQLGIDGPAAMSMLAEGAQKGMYGIDKAGDAVKEFTIRATDMSESSKGAYKAIGLDAGKMAQDILAGGDTARAATDKIVDGILSIKDPAKQANAAIALFGTPLEDLSTKDIPKFLSSLQSGEDSLGKWEGATKRAGDTLNNNASTNLTAFTRGLKSGLVETIGGRVLPAVNDLTAVLGAGLGPAFDTVTDTLSEHEGVAKGVGLALAAFLVPNLVLTGIEATKSAIKTVAAFVMQQVEAAKTVAKFIIARTVMVAGWVLMGAQALLGAAKVAAAWLIAMGPVGIVIGLVVGLTVLVVKNWDTIKSATTKAFGAVKDFLLGAWDTIKSKVSGAVESVKNAVSNAWDKVKDWTKDAVDSMVSWFRDLPGRITGALSGLRDKVGDVFRTAMEWAKEKVTGIGGTIMDWIRGIPDKIGELGSKFGDAGRDLLQRFIDGMKNAAGIIAGIAGKVWDTVRGLLNGAIDRINAALEFTINLPGPKDLHVDLPNIPHLATGGRATGSTLAVIGEGREAETVLPDSLLRGLLEKAHAAGAASAQSRDSGRTAPLIGTVNQAPGESADALAERLWFKTRTRG